MRPTNFDDPEKVFRLAQAYAKQLKKAVLGPEYMQQEEKPIEKETSNDDK
jgi:hypothetical protein